jgi:hypothetical protein
VRVATLSSVNDVILLHLLKVDGKLKMFCGNGFNLFVQLQSSVEVLYYLTHVFVLSCVLHDYV